MYGGHPSSNKWNCKHGIFKQSVYLLFWNDGFEKLLSLSNKFWNTKFFNVPPSENFSRPPQWSRMLPRVLRRWLTFPTRVELLFLPQDGFWTNFLVCVPSRTIQVTLRLSVKSLPPFSLTKSKSKLNCGAFSKQLLKPRKKAYFWELKCCTLSSVTFLSRETSKER